MTKKNRKETVSSRLGNLKQETTHTIYSILLFVATLLLGLAAFHKAGIVGKKLYGALSLLLGVGYFILPLTCMLLGIAFLKSIAERVALPRIVGGLVLMGASLGIIELLSAKKGGIIGKLVAVPLLKLFDFSASLIFLVSLTIIAILVMFDTHLSLERLLFWRKKKGEEEIEPIMKDARALETEDEEAEVAPLIKDEKKEDYKPKKQERREDGVDLSAMRQLGRPYVPPPLTLLERDKGKPGVGDIKANTNIIKRTLQNFGIQVEMDEVSIGPSVTRYALKPAEGMKLSKIVGLQNDLSLALAAHPLRIEAPIPGKSLVGIEIPNTTKTTVGLATLLSEEEFQNSEKPLLISLGKGISGKSHFSNLGKAPHLLIAGATGTGKSVTIHAILTSLLYRNSPESLKFIMIDPKRVELTLYNKIPHLLTPVITEAKKTILALKWAAKEMDRRYDILEQNSVRDIESYHKNILAPEIKKLEGKDRTTLDEETLKDIPETMPYIVIVIDELADIMQAYPRELESAIVRLAQMSRAVGIHLILSTQRPSVNVITGLIKANIPSRIALQVTSQIDSRTILDTIGAEKLLGAGDMLYMSGDMAKPQRLQSAFISESEVKQVVKYLADAYQDELSETLNLTSEGVADKNAIFESTFDNEDTEDDDDLYEEAREIVLHAGKASTSYLQRKLRIGYARAARLIDILEERGVIGRGDGSKPREVINPISSPESPTDEQV